MAEENELYDEDDGGLTGTPNWADWLNVLLCIPFYFVKGMMRMLEGINALLDLQSKNIDARKDFSNAVHQAIESLNEKDD